MLFSLRVLAFPHAVLLSGECRGRFGTLYEDLNPATRSRLFTTTFHNLRLCLMIPVLVLTSSSALAQSVVYLTSALAGTIWDIALRPYDGILMAAQMYLMGAARLVAGVGFVVLSVPSITQATANHFLQYEMNTLITAMAGGLALAVIQQTMGVCIQIRERCKRRSEEKPVCAAGTVTDMRSEITMSQDVIMVRHGE